MFNRGRYNFIMIENGKTILEARYMLKINGLNALNWHRKFNHRLQYKLIDTKTGEEVREDITYTLLKGPNV